MNAVLLAGLGENQTKLRLHSFPVSGLLLFFYFFFLNFSFLWPRSAVKEPFVYDIQIPNFQIFSNIFTICVKIQIEP